MSSSSAATTLAVVEEEPESRGDGSWRKNANEYVVEKRDQYERKGKDPIEAVLEAIFKVCPDSRCSPAC